MPPVCKNFSKTFQLERLASAFQFSLGQQVGFENRDPGSGNSQDLMNFLASRFPGVLTKIPGIFSTVTQSKSQKIFVRSSQALGWFCAKLANSILLGTVTTQHHLY